MTNNELRRLALEQREVLLARLGNTPVDAWRFNGIEAMIVLSALNLAAVAERQEPAPFRERVKSVEHLIQAGCGEDRLSWDMAVAIDRKYSEWFSPAPQPTGVGAVWRTRGAFYRAAWFSGRTRHGFRLARTARWLSEDGQRLNSPAAQRSGGMKSSTARLRRTRWKSTNWRLRAKNQTEATRYGQVT